MLRIVLARAARSARLTTHFDLDFPRESQREPYWCFKHKRECRPIDHAGHFVRRYTLDTLDATEGIRTRAWGTHSRSRARRRLRDRPRQAVSTRVITSPPYPGLIDYHEQHRYAYELLGLDDLRERELGAAAQGTSRAALGAYSEGIAAVLARAAGALPRRGAIVDRRQRPP